MSHLTPQQLSAWADHIETQPQSGLSQKAYCTQHGLKPHCFWYWKRKLKTATSKNLNRSKSRQQSGFVPVTVSTTQQPQALSIVLPNGVTLNGIAEHNLPVVQQLVGSLL